MSVIFRARGTGTLMTGDAATELKDAMRTLRELELHLTFFNLGFASVLVCLKVFYLGGTISAGFSAIRLIHINPVLGCLYTYIFLGCIITYVGMFGFAYKVTEKLEESTKVIEIASRSLVNPGERKYWTKVVRSIPRMGMSVGGFSQVEREAIPILIDFCVKQIVTLLLAFP